jgi:hypothetical protein
MDEPAAGAAEGVATPAPVPAYEPTVDMYKVDPAQYQRDLADCRRQAASSEPMVPGDSPDGASLSDYVSRVNFCLDHYGYIVRS